jgi:hypothetical protein
MANYQEPGYQLIDKGEPVFPNIHRMVKGINIYITARKQE